tara:strand:+ start:523 stop:738 length:216 start_codon:yes stop_codon:yes gene_type:complete
VGTIKERMLEETLKQERDDRKKWTRDWLRYEKLEQAQRKKSDTVKDDSRKLMGIFAALAGALTLFLVRMAL